MHEFATLKFGLSTLLIFTTLQIEKKHRNWKRQFQISGLDSSLRDEILLLIVLIVFDCQPTLT